MKRIERWALLVSLVLGVAAVAVVGRAFAEYRDVTRAYSAVDAEYVPDSFVWLDPDYHSGQVELRVVNRSPRPVTIEYLDLHLYFDGRFAGSDYATWQPFDIDESAEKRVTIGLQVSISSLQPQAADALIALRGQIRLRFEGIERPLTVRLNIPVGHVGTQ